MSQPASNTASSTAELPTAVELTQALLELGVKLAASAGAEAATECLARELERLFRATCSRERAEAPHSVGSAIVGLAEGAWSLGRVTADRIEGEPFSLSVPIRAKGAPLDRFVLLRSEPFTELEQNCADLGAALLERALAQGALLDELRDSRTQLEQSERVKSVGQLASGVAHDFNNLLMVISAAAEVAGDALPPGHPSASHLSLILDTSHRAAEVTRKLLAFSRKGRPVTKPVDLHALLGTVREFLAHGLDPRIRLQLSLCEGPCVVDADATQLESAILNVCLNARDAMPDGGLLRIATSRVELDAAACAGRFRGCQPGHFVRLDIKDTGTGMDQTTLARAFEPFFTTKEPGRGTGLGLPVALAAVRDHKGGVLLESEPGGGTRCSMLLPLAEPVLGEASSAAPGSRRLPALRVLLVDDEAGVCLTAAQLMRQLGHNVQALCSGEKALSHLRVHASAYDLLVLDVMMPHPTGPEVQRALQRDGIDLPTLFMSGSATAELPGEGTAPGAAVYLSKPFRQAELALAITRCMEASQSRSRAAIPVARRAG